MFPGFFLAVCALAGLLIGVAIGYYTGDWRAITVCWLGSQFGAVAVLIYCRR